MVGVTGSIPVAPTIILLRTNRFFKHSNAGLSHVVGIQQQFMPITPQSIPSRGRLRDSLRARLREACKFLALTSFGGSPYSLDESGVVKCVLKAGCAAGTRMQIADKMSVDLAASPEPIPRLMQG
jgi:hypothetical protein